ncbi:hypothetical protein CCACVL1_21036 [Corchorus capsularis]|uniref:SET domain-containing protein n=1 Tax=Corchorus capsularis TaxID=210143 RepID=A0A1R3H8N6_COCAP|nr:hypothetical protein CCACVL1_21036 [Corchorus capsularis]
MCELGTTPLSGETYGRQGITIYLHLFILHSQTFPNSVAGISKLSISPFDAEIAPGNSPLARHFLFLPFLLNYFFKSTTNYQTNPIILQIADTTVSFSEIDFWNYCQIFCVVVILEAMPATKKSPGCNRIDYAFSKLLKQIGNPVDFELPDWFNKSKPIPYTFIKRNIYLTKKVKRRLEDDGIFCSCTSSPGSSVCGRDCHCGMLLSSCSSGCSCGDSCLNKPFQNRPVKKMKLVQTEKCGAGIVAEEDIKHGEFVIEYVGEVIDDKTCEERLWNMKHRGETNFYLCEINRDMVIDATYKGNKSRYINHSCNPNTEMQKWIIDGETRIGIFAMRDIRKGEHLTYDYQFVQFGADQDCHCGAAGCRQKLGVKPSKPKISSDAALKLVACQVALSSPKLKAMLFGNNTVEKTLTDYRFFFLFFFLLLLFRLTGMGLISGSSRHAYRGQTGSRCCIGEVIKISRSMNERSFGIIKRFDKYSKKHLVMFEDGVVEFLDMSKEEWELITL